MFIVVKTVIKTKFFKILPFLFVNIFYPAMLYVSTYAHEWYASRSWFKSVLAIKLFENK